MTQGPNSELARFIGSLLPSAIHVQHGAAIHRTLIAFHTGILLEFVKRSFHKAKGGSLDEGALAWVLPAAIGPLAACASSEVKAAKDSLVSEVIVSVGIVPNWHPLNIHTALVVPSAFRPISYMPAVYLCVDSNSESGYGLRSTCFFEASHQDVSKHLRSTPRNFWRDYATECRQSGSQVEVSHP